VVLPTRIARNGSLLTRHGRVNLRNAQYRLRDEPADPTCGCSTCTCYSVAYLHHLFRCEELLAYRLATYHNLWFMTHLMSEIRQSIIEQRFADFRRRFHEAYRPPDAAAAAAQRARRRVGRTGQARWMDDEVGSADG
jgi:queuine tRNA-ribosyltransferase